MYRNTARSKKIAKKFQNMRNKRAAIRLNDRRTDHSIPELRRTVIVIDWDFGRTINRMDFYKNDDRIDCYDVETNGKPWKQKIGWSRSLEWLRKAYPRIGKDI